MENSYEIALTVMSKVRMFKENEPFIEYNNLDWEDHDNHFAVLIEDDFKGSNFRK